VTGPQNTLPQYLLHLSRTLSLSTGAHAHSFPRTHSFALPILFCPCDTGEKPSHLYPVLPHLSPPAPAPPPSACPCLSRTHNRLHIPRKRKTGSERERERRVTPEQVHHASKSLLRRFAPCHIHLSHSASHVRICLTRASHHIHICLTSASHTQSSLPVIYTHLTGYYIETRVPQLYSYGIHARDIHTRAV
jgi:hypothetical protein